ncbi:hypothetical protein BLA29_011129, partial [Euroglyphus maynei]
MIDNNQKGIPDGLNDTASDMAQYVYKQYGVEKKAQRDFIRENIIIPEWKMKEELVVSGMSGRFPESDSIDEFEYHMYNGIDM